ncbi:MAG: hypothetical protein AAFP69_19165 [Planctomycetota bacterium]
MKKLAEKDQQLLQTRYGLGSDPDADHAEKTPITNAMQKRLQRVRILMFDCVHKTMDQLDSDSLGVQP